VVALLRYVMRPNSMRSQPERGDLAGKPSDGGGGGAAGGSGGPREPPAPTA
jgi:hypothetical protein